MIRSRALIETAGVLNKYKIDYVIIGAYACAYHGHTRATNDIDILVEDSDQNLSKVIDCIKELYPHIKEKITVEDIRKNIVLKIVDEPEIDISIMGWNIKFIEVTGDIEFKEIDGVKIPFLGLTSLIKSKESPREIDQWDVRVLREIVKSKKK